MLLPDGRGSSVLRISSRSVNRFAVLLKIGIGLKDMRKVVRDPVKWFDLRFQRNKLFLLCGKISFCFPYLCSDIGFAGLRHFRMCLEIPHSAAVQIELVLVLLFVALLGDPEYLPSVFLITAVSDKNRQAMELMAYAEAIREWLEETYREKELTIREDLETKVNEIFERMYHGHRRVAINAKYHVELLTTVADKEIAAGESEGSNRVKNFAFIAGLVALAKGKIVTDSSENGINLSSEPYPLVMDAPFSNADETHTANISKVLPEIAEQVIMFVMQKDWNYAEPVMSDHVGQRYHLNKISETYTRLSYLISLIYYLFCLMKVQKEMSL